MKKAIAFALAMTLLRIVSAHAGTATINPTNSCAWGANIGWTSWRPDPDATNTTGVRIEEFICSGYIYAANIGWINLGNGFIPSAGPPLHVQYSNSSPTDFGVNYQIDPAQPGVAILRGYAYGANIGWINFEATGNPRVSLFTGTFSGYAYSANCGWINLNDALGRVQTDHVAPGLDSDGDGIADAFEILYFGDLTTANVTSDRDGDGISDRDEYFDGTNPLLRDDKLRIISFATNPNGTSSPINWTSTTARLYLIETNPDLVSMWSPDPIFGMPFAPDSGSSTARILTAASATKRFYRVKSVRPLP